MASRPLGAPIPIGSTWSWPSRTRDPGRLPPFRRGASWSRQPRPLSPTPIQHRVHRRSWREPASHSSDARRCRSAPAFSIYRNADTGLVNFRCCRDRDTDADEVALFDFHVRGGEIHRRRALGVDSHQRDVPFSGFRAGDDRSGVRIEDRLERQPFVARPPFPDRLRRLSARPLSCLWSH